MAVDAESQDGLVRSGLGVPTATEGMVYPVPDAEAAEAVELAVQAERLGYAPAVPVIGADLAQLDAVG